MKKLALDLEICEVKQLLWGTSTKWENGTLTICKEKSSRSLEL